MSAAGKRLINSARQALAIAKGDAAPARIHAPADVDVRALRKQLGMTQHEFSARYGISIDTLRKWERGDRRPEGPARVLLMVIKHAPEAVERALNAA